jgi:hypothetical protein
MATIEHYILPSPETTGAKPKCDFCSTPDPTHCFIADDVALVMQKDPEKGKKLQALIMSSDPHWGACDGCAVLIERGDKQALYERCLASFKRLMPEEGGDAVSMMSLKIIQDTMFWAVFTGKRHAASAHLKIEI